MSEPKRPSAFKEFDARLGKARPEKPGAAGGGDEPPPRLDYGSGLQAGIEVVAGVGFGPRCRSFSSRASKPSNPCGRSSSAIRSSALARARRT